MTPPLFSGSKSCPKEPEKTLISKSPCLETSDMYITVYITAYNQFTDVPAASVIVPYRVAADENTLMHVSGTNANGRHGCVLTSRTETDARHAHARLRYQRQRQTRLRTYIAHRN